MAGSYLKFPSHYVCGSPNHALICRHGGLTFVRHNELRYLTAIWLQEVCHDVTIKSPLQPLTGESITPGSANRDDWMIKVYGPIEPLFHPCQEIL